MRSSTRLILLWGIALGCSRCREAPAPADSQEKFEQPKGEEKRPADLRRDIFERSARVEVYGEERTELVAVGSGIHFDDDVVLTAAHVVGKGKAWSYQILEVRDERIHTFMEGGVLVGVDTARDVAVLRTEERSANRTKRSRIPIASAPLEEAVASFKELLLPHVQNRVGLLTYQRLAELLAKAGHLEIAQFIVQRIAQVVR